MNRISVTVASAVLAAAVALAPSTRAGVEDIAEAMKVLDQVNQLTAGLTTLNVTLPAPTPIMDNSGAFLSPYRCDGTPTEWSNKAMNAAAGSAVGGMAAEKAAASIPFVGGFFGKKAKAVGAQAGAETAAGGKDFIKSTSDTSFATADELAVFLQAKHAAVDPDFAKRVSAAMAIYPDLKANYAKAVQTAVDAAKASAAAAPAVAPAAAPVAGVAAPAVAPAAVSGCK